MDEKVPTCCPNCSQPYYLKLESSKLRGNLPLLQACGHSMCENCIKNILKFEEPIQCKICFACMMLDTVLKPLLLKEKNKLYNFFPINIYMVGELTVQLMDKSKSNAPTEEKEFFIDLQAILKEHDITNVLCMECHRHTTKKCKECATYLCDSCFTKSHKNFVIFKSHVLQDVEETVLPCYCKIHKDKPLDYYCHDCKKSVCMNCLMVGRDKSCKNHNVVSMEEINESFLEELATITPQVDETFRRLTKTAYDIGHLLYNMENDTGSTSELTLTIATIEQHFSKLCSIVQNHKEEVMNIVTKLKSVERESLYGAKKDLVNVIKKASRTMDLLRMTSNPTKFKQMNLSELLQDAKEIAEHPWYLTRDVDKNGALKVEVKEDLCSLITDYIRLEGKSYTAYKLYATKDLGDDVEIPAPPPAPVFAPVLPRDVRQTKDKNKPKTPNNKEDKVNPRTYFQFAPQYRAKSESVTSLNSTSTDSSRASYKQNNQKGTVFDDINTRTNVQPVHPFVESQPPKQLMEGTQELIYISHIVDPHNFYVQRACHQVLVKEMLRQFKNSKSLPEPAVSFVTEGKTYLAFNKVDDMWQRCRVLSVDRNDPTHPLIQVFSIDFGSIETVTIDKLRLLPTARLHSPYPLAINCSLANCEPINRMWASQDSLLIQNIIDNKQAVIHVRHIRSMSNGRMKLDVDVTTFEDGISIAHALVFHERARITNPRLKHPPNSGIREKVKIFVTNDDYKPRAVEEVVITHVVSPDKFYVRKKHQQEIYEILSLDLEQDYSNGVTGGSIYLPEIGMSCCVQAEAGWARAVVSALPGRGRVRVLLVDTGEARLLLWTALRYMLPKYARLCALATECHLTGVTPINKKWSPSSVALMQKYQDKELELHVDERRTRASISVTVFDKSDEENIVCINQEMIKYKFAITFGIYSFNKNLDVDDQVITNKSPLDPPTRRRPKADKIQILTKKTEPKVNHDLEAKDKGPLRLEAKVLQYQSPSLIYISLVHQQKTFNDLFEDIQKYYSKNKPVKKLNWQVGDRCCAICVQSETWRRAIIVELEKDKAKIFYSDFASIETVPIAELAEIPPDCALMGDAAIKCHLSGVIPAMGEQWPSLTKEFLKELLDSYQRVFITKLGNFKDKSMPIEIWAYHTIQGSALEPNKSEWRCLNRKIIEQGLGVADKVKQPTSTEVKVEGEGETLSFLNVTGSVRDWLQLEPMPTMPVLPTAHPESPSSSSPGVDDVNQEELESSNVIFISDWLPPEPLSNKEFTAMPTYIDNDGVIYLHNVSQEGTLDLIRKALDMRFENPDPKAKFQKWVVGEPCIAQYFLDNRFYRGRVIDVNNEASICLIHYIDYGNEEQCSFTNMRKSIALHQVPTQARKCILNRIQPRGQHWDRQTLDYIHKSIVEKECCVNVAGDSVNDILPIELKYDKLWINDHLVEFEMAKYKDGSKAVIRKYAPTYRKKSTSKSVVAVSDSEPDYIIEDSQSSAQESFDISSLKAKDWNEILDEDLEESLKMKFVSFSNIEDEEFKCNITVINGTKTMGLDIIRDRETELLYEEMYNDLQLEGNNMSSVNGIFENKACLVLCQEDQQWYRASILQYSESKGVKVKYVDYGNVEVVSLDDLREIHEEWLKFEPNTVTVQLHGIQVNPNFDISVVMKEYQDTFLGKGPFTAKVIKNDGLILNVELKNENGELVYQNLIDKEVLLKCEPE